MTPNMVGLTRQNEGGPVGDAHFRRIFENSPIPTYEQDYTKVVTLLAQHRANGVKDIIAHLESHPAHFEELLAAVKVRIANRAAIEAFDYDPAANGNRIAFASAGSRKSFLQQVAAVWHGATEMYYEFNRDRGRPGPRECALHWSVADTPDGPDFAHVVISIADISGRRDPDQQLQQRADQLRLLHEVNREISSHLALDDVLHTITTGVSRVLEAAWVELILLDEMLDAITDRVAIGLSGPPPNIEEVRAGLAGWVLRHGSSTLTPAVKSDPRTTGKAFDSALASDFGSVVVAPLTVAGRRRGTLAAGLTEGAKVFARSDLEILELMAAHASFAIQNATSVGLIEVQIEARDKLVASVAHELRTPLGNASGLASELVESWDTMEPDERHRLVALIAQESNDASNIVEDLLVSARAELGQLPLLRQPIDLAVQARSAVESFGEQSQESITIHGESPTVVADPVRVRQILRNVITNALRYGGENISISLGRDTACGTVRVIDDGPGVEPELEETMFSDFTRASAPHESSVGLGLSISRQLAHLMGGDLRYLRDGGNTVFELALPLG